MPKKSYDVIIPHNHKARPAELEAAGILANHFKTTVRLLPKSERFRESSADFLIDGNSYELKSPITSKVSSMEKIIRLASRQSANVVIDIRRSKITEKRMIEICKDRLINIKRLKKIVLIVKNKKVLEFM